MKKGLEKYSRTDEGAWYSFKWVNLPTGASGVSISTEDDCPMHEEPLKLLTPEIAMGYMNDLNKHFKDRMSGVKDSERMYRLKLLGELDPRCKKYLNELLQIYKGDLFKVIDGHIRVVRKVYSEADRVGISTFSQKTKRTKIRQN